MEPVDNMSLPEDRWLHERQFTQLCSLFQCHIFCLHLHFHRELPCGDPLKNREGSIRG